MEQFYFRGCCVEYADIVTREEMVRVLRSCAESIRSDVAVRESLLDFVNPVHDLTTFKYIVMHQTTNLIMRHSFDEIVDALLTLANVLDEYTCERLTETDWVSVTVRLSTLQ